jgi:hypothetical protein
MLKSKEDRIEKFKIIDDYFKKNPASFEQAKNQIANFSLEEKLKYGTLTINEISNLIKLNKSRAEKLKIKLTWGIKNKRVYGQMLSEKQVIFEKFYDLEFAHVCLAKMQFDFDNELNSLDI